MLGVEVACWVWWGVGCEGGCAVVCGGVGCGDLCVDVDVAVLCVGIYWMWVWMF